MTKAIHDQISKDANGNINNHLQSHIHLTNCIHLKNHMHKHSPILAERLLMRDLVILQRSQSLRDPSMSPPLWHAPVVDLLHRGGENDAVVGNGRLCVGLEQQKNGRELPSGSSQPESGLPTSGMALGDASRWHDGVADVGDCRSERGVQERRSVQQEESSGRNLGTDLMNGSDQPQQNANALDLGIISGNSGKKSKKIKNSSTYRQHGHLKMLCEQLNDIPVDSDGVGSSNIRRHGRCTLNENIAEQAEACMHGYCSGLSTVKRSKFRGMRTRATMASKGADAQNEISVASNSLARDAAHPNFHKEDGEEETAELNFTKAPRNGCGATWNWSRIHHRGKTFLDMAGRSLSCGLSNSKLEKGSPIPRGRDGVDMPMMSDCLSSSSKSVAQALPLLDGSGCKGSTENGAWVHDYSGELGIIADNLLEHETDSDLASKARCGGQHKFRRNGHDRHQHLTQKYMPRTFRELVGQHLVAQALSNAVVKRKVGLLYVFYGPHGTGKTSCAWIFARALNCQSMEHSKPCGFCHSCVALDKGKSQNIRAVGPVSNFDFESIMDLLDSMIVSHLPSQYKVFIFDDCDTLSRDCWRAISKVIDRIPRRVVFVLVCSSLDVLPHIIMSRCQKFFFSKLKDADIIYTLHRIATKEDVKIDKDALKLIASRSDGSLRDAEMTLEQLSLLGHRISIRLVQEMVGLLSDEKLVDLLDLALSADTVNTVKNLREIMESGVEPLAMMSQLATVITDILAGSYDFAKEGPKRKFFRQKALSKEDMEKLRQALKTLSDAEKQLRTSNDRLTWLTAALVQLAPDEQYKLPSFSAGTSFNQSPLGLSSASGRERSPKSNEEHAGMPNTERRLSTLVRKENLHTGSSSDIYYSSKMRGTSVDKKGHAGYRMVTQQTIGVPGGKSRVGSCQLTGKFQKEVEEIWSEVLEKIQIDSIKEFMHQEGKLISVSFGSAPTVQLMFSSHLTTCKAEKFRAQILQAFETVIGSPLTIEIRCELRKDVGGANMTLFLPAIHDDSSQIYSNQLLPSSNELPALGYDISKSVLEVGDGLTKAQLSQLGTAGMGRSEIVEVEASSRECEGNLCFNYSNNSDARRMESAWTGITAATHKNSTMGSLSERRKLGEQNQSPSWVRSKVSLAHVIQHAEGGTEQNRRSKHKAVSIAEKLEHENLRLEHRSRNLLCWKASRVARQKVSRLKIRTRRPQTLLKMVSCGKCLRARSPR